MGIAVTFGTSADVRGAKERRRRRRILGMRNAILVK
jgi:hypothetical protein